jgi:hypothetical protein
MSDVDYRHVADLLKVIEGTTGHSNKLNSIAAAAMAELAAINEELRAEAMEAAKEAEAKAAEEAALAAEKRKAEEAAAAKAAETEDDSGPKAVPAANYRRP